MQPNRAAHPYSAVIGVFFRHDHNEVPGSYRSCTATAVTSKNESTVWTSAHCVNDGIGGPLDYGVFIPGFNDDAGADLAALNPWDSASIGPHAPYGVFAVQRVWIPDGWDQAIHDDVITPAIAGRDYAAITVARNAAGQTLTQAVGQTVPIAFDPPLDQVARVVNVYGYPATPPFDGTAQYRCDQTPQVLSEPVTVLGDSGREFRIGCRMTPGCSGGPWLATVNGVSMVVGNSSFSDQTAGWLAATVLSDGARQLFERASGFAP